VLFQRLSDDYLAKLPQDGAQPAPST